MKRYTNQYRSQRWLYTVFGSVEGNDYILLAVVPGIGWSDIAMRLTEEEVATLKRSEDDFTEFVNDFVHGRELPKYKIRRIESNIRTLDNDEIGLMDEG